MQNFSQILISIKKQLWIMGRQDIAPATFRIHFKIVFILCV